MKTIMQPPTLNLLKSVGNLGETDKCTTERYRILFGFCTAMYSGEVLNCRQRQNRTWRGARKERKIVQKKNFLLQRGRNGKRKLFAALKVAKPATLSGSCSFTPKSSILDLIRWDSKLSLNLEWNVHVRKPRPNAIGQWPLRTIQLIIRKCLSS